MAQFRTDKHGIVRDSTSIYWFTGSPTNGTKCDIYESDKGMFAVVKEPNTKPELWEYQYTDEAVDENITINEYEFTEDGKRY